MKQILIPDVHLDLGFVQGILDKEKVDLRTRNTRLTFMGDIADTRNIEIDPNPMKMMQLISDMSENPDVEILPGNHDLFHIEEMIAYRWEVKNGEPSFGLQRPCTIRGKTQADVDLYRTAYKELGKHPKDIFKTVHTKAKIGSSDILITHAGLHDFHYERNGNDMGLVTEAMEAQYNDLYVSDFRREYHMITDVGSARQGNGLYGGILWRDDVAEPTVVPVNQIYGHTATEDTASLTRHTMKEGRYRYFNLCLDGQQSTYGVIEDGVVKVRSINGYFAFMLFEGNQYRYYPNLKEVRIAEDGSISLDIA